MRTTTSAATAGAALTLGLLLSACSPSAGEAAPAATTSSALSAAATAEPTPEPEPTVAATGTRENPAQPDVDTLAFTEAGAPVYDVMLSKANFAANDVLSAHYQFNEPPPAGSTYVLLPITATYHGTEPGQAWFDLRITYVAADGRTFEPSLAFVPDDLTVTPELTAGAVARGNLPFAIPEDALTGGVWSVVHAMGTSKVPQFVTAA